jgi:hypothetical protein
MDIAAEIGDKNPKRVAGQLRRQVDVQRQRVVAHIITALLLSAVAAGGLYVAWIPRGLAMVCAVLVVISILGAVFDGILMRRKREKLRAVEAFLARPGA